jgi:methionyl aminopeptidase
VLRHRDRPRLKTAEEVTRMREAGRMVAEVLEALRSIIAPGVTTGDLNDVAGEKMKELGGIPSFLGYVVQNKTYPANICVSVEDEIVHGIPGRCTYRGHLVPDRVLEAGQVVTVDCGVIYEGYHGDSAVTLPVGEISSEKAALLETCRLGLWAGIKQLRPGNRLTDVAQAIETQVLDRQRELGVRYGVVQEYVGHGIGESLHEAPQVPNYVSSHLRRNDLVLEPGLVIAIEPMVCMGTRKTKELADGWTVVTRDGLPSAHFEHTIAVTADGFQVLTARADGQTTH